MIEAQLSGFNEVIYAREQDYFKNYQIKLLKTILFPFCTAQQERKMCWKDFDRRVMSRPSFRWSPHRTTVVQINLYKMLHNKNKKSQKDNRSVFVSNTLPFFDAI